MNLKSEPPLIPPWTRGDMLLDALSLLMQSLMAIVFAKRTGNSALTSRKA
jgi:hypothetical protein